MDRYRNRATEAAAGALENVSPYVDRLAHDERLRARLIAALTAGVAARRRAQQRVGLMGLARTLGSDPVLRAQVVEALDQLQKAKSRLTRPRSHKGRNFLLFVAGGGMVVAAVPSLRNAVMEKARSLRRDPFSPVAAASIAQEIEVEVPVATAYNQWTQFEEFPRFMEGVDSVEQLDDTLLHWAATVAGKKAEWDAKIVEQRPNERIVWESTDGKETRGIVTFEPANSGTRTRIRLAMSYKPDGISERAGSAIGLDRRRVRGDLERFRELIEGRRVESGAWGGEIRDGETIGDRTP